ncbi:MAG: DUF2147 domain-containing protein [Bacteroidota bacterium]
MKNKVKKSLLISACFALFLGFVAMSDLQAQSVLGKWKTIDDETGDVKSIVELYMVGEKVHGKVVQLFRKPDEDPDPVCDECDDDDPRYNKKVLGMEILTGLEKESNEEWEDGDILDPKNGSVYSCYIELVEPDKLKVRGYLGVSLLGRTQYWYRVK